MLSEELDPQDSEDVDESVEDLAKLGVSVRDGDDDESIEDDADDDDEDDDLLVDEDDDEGV